jgi:GNAT superfamily N-acetyltransferase
MIKYISYSEIPEKILHRAECEQIPFPNKGNVQYFGYFEGNNIVGTIGVQIFKNGNGKITGDYILKDYRDAGIQKKLIKTAIGYARYKEIKYLKCNCLKEDLKCHLNKGAKIEKESKYISYIVYDLREGEQLEASTP